MKSWSFPRWASGPSQTRGNIPAQTVAGHLCFFLSLILTVPSRPSPAPGQCPFSSPEYLDKGFFSPHLHFLRDGRLSLGDELLVINGHLLVGLSHEEAVAILRSATGTVQLVVASKVGSLFLVLVFNIFNIKIGGEFGFEPFPHTLTHTLCHTHSLHTYLQVYRGHLNGRDSPGLGFILVHGSSDGKPPQS